MSPGAVLVVLVVSSGGEDPAGPAMEAAARELMGESASIRVKQTPENLSDADTLQSAGAADGVVELVWSDDHQSALLHCYVTQDARWVDRRITFSESDREADRGRLLGFAIASMFPRLVVPAEAPQKTPAPVDVLESRPTTERTSSLRAPGRIEVELGVSATTGIRGPADSLGGNLGLRFKLVPSLAVRVAAGAQLGDIPEAGATTRGAFGAVGLAWSVSPDSSPAALGLRFDLLGSWVQFRRESDAETETRSRWLFGGAVVAEGGYRFWRGFGVYGGAGAQALLGETDIYVADRFAAKLPTFRVVGELGLRAAF